MSMYSIKQLWSGVKHPELVASKINGAVNHLRVGEQYYPDGVDVFAADWDNLVILDACRYDFFEEQATLEGVTEKRLSRGTTSREFIRGNFAKRKTYDTVYASANPWYIRLQEQIGSEVHAYRNLHTDEIRDAVGGLTTKPKTVTEHALQAHEDYPNKRLIIHYLQPHQPYLSEFGRERFETHRDTMLAVKHSDVERDDVVRAYRENLDIVLEEAAQLIELLPGKTVVTSDHGELLGEREQPIPVRRFGHPGGVYVEELLTVPWHVNKTGSRKKVVAEKPADRTNSRAEAGAVKQQLENLGYRL